MHYEQLCIMGYVTYCDMSPSTMNIVFLMLNFYQKPQSKTKYGLNWLAMFIFQEFDTESLPNMAMQDYFCCYLSTITGSHNAYLCQITSNETMCYAIVGFMHNLAGTNLVTSLGYALLHFMHYELMHYELINCIFKIQYPRLT